jgi:glycosyltransferase involved in cell wall biosynthesis
MHQSKIVLNTLTWFKDGSHDRIFNGMLAGAVVVSDSSRYLKEQFENHRELELFELEEIETLPDIVEGLLSDLPRAQQMADRGRAAAQARHTWAHRAIEIEKTWEEG